MRLQWMRADEHGWDPKGPPTLLDYGALSDEDGRIVAWEADVYLPVRPIERSGVTLLAAVLAGLPKDGAGSGIYHPGLGIPYAVANDKLVAHWLAETPLPAACAAETKATMPYRERDLRRHCACRVFPRHLTWNAARQALRWTEING